jgi:hypothetical protein
MKYTRYLINGKILDYSFLETKNPYFKPATDIVRVVGIFAGAAGLTLAFPIALIADSYRSAKYYTILYNKNHLHFKLKTDRIDKFLNRDIPDIHF